jgi:hypothetical protein
MRMKWAGHAAWIEDVEMHTKFRSENLKERDHLEVDHRDTG